MANEQYLVLHSSATAPTFQSNTPSVFKNKLATVLDLNGHWEVAMDFISLPRTWNTIANPILIRATPQSLTTEDELIDAMRIGTSFRESFEKFEKIAVNFRGELARYGPRMVFEIPAGNYSSPEEISNIFNKEFQRGMSDSQMQKFSLGMGFNWSQSRFEFFPKGLSDCFFFPINPKDPSRTQSIFKPYFNLNSSDPDGLKQFGFHFKIFNPLSPNYERVHMIYHEEMNRCDLFSNKEIVVKTDFTEKIGYGTALEPVLSVIPIKGGSNQSVYIKPNPRSYIPVEKKRIDTLEIRIEDLKGADMAMKSGETLIGLHFRRAMSALALAL